MKTEVILHNSISLDGSLTDFEPHMGLHYRIAGEYNPQIHLIGSNTILKGIELYGEGVPPEEESDFEQPQRDSHLPYWALVDTGGSLKGILHTCRRFEFCRDVVVLVSEKTPKSYLDFLRERHYDFYILGRDHVNLKRALELFSKTFLAERVLVDTGKILGNRLLNEGLVTKISLLVHPVIVGQRAYSMFSGVDKNITLKLLRKEILEKGYVWLEYKVERR